MSTKSTTVSLTEQKKRQIARQNHPKSTASTTAKKSLGNASIEEKNLKIEGRSTIKRAKTAVAGEGFDRRAGAVRLKRVTVERFENDLMVSGYVED